MQRSVLIHAPELSTPGGKQTFYTAVKDHFKSDITFFLYGAHGKKESKLTTLRRLISDYSKFYRSLKRERYDAVILNPSLNPKSFFRDSVFMMLCSLTRTKTIVFWHGWRWDFEKKVIQKIIPFFRFSFGKADAMILLASDFLKRVESFGYKNKAYLGTTVVDDTLFEIGDKNQAFHQRSLSPNDPITLLFLARVEVPKGIYETIDSFIELKKDYPNLKMNIAGTGSALEEVKNRITERNISDVELLGWISGPEKAKTFCDADIYVFASYTEGMPISLLEAMATGMALITTDVGGIKDFFENGKMGRIVEVKNTADLKAKIEEFLKNPEEINKIGTYNRTYARQNFTAVEVTKKIESVIEDVVNDTYTLSNPARKIW